VGLRDQNWNGVSFHSVVRDFLLAERDKLAELYPPWLPLVDAPNLSEALENQRRLRLLYLRRLMFTVEIPSDTVWFETRLTQDDMGQLYVSARHNRRWDAAGNLLGQVEQVERLEFKALPHRWKRIILWGHERAGPFTILEGNHRLLVYAYSNPPPLDIMVYVGLSSSHCFWHRLDPTERVGADLIKPNISVVPANDWLYVRW
jgi:hypothetical protein